MGTEKINKTETKKRSREWVYLKADEYQEIDKEKAGSSCWLDLKLVFCDQIDQ